MSVDRLKAARKSDLGRFAKRSRWRIPDGPGELKKQEQRDGLRNEDRADSSTGLDAHKRSILIEMLST